METVGYAALGSEINHLIHHIARACHAETHVVSAVEYHVGCLNEILGTFLHRDTAEECYHLFFACVVGTWNVLIFLGQGIDRIVHGEALAGVLMILIDDGLARQF